MTKPKAKPPAKKPAPAARKPARRPEKAAGKGSSVLDAVRAELVQLATIRGQFAEVPDDMAAGLLAHHDEESCREKGKNTRAADIFRAAMSWARTFGEHASDPALSQVRVRWFLDCATALGNNLSGRAPAPNPPVDAEDLTTSADRLLKRTERRARDATGTNRSWRAALDRALTPDGVHDDRVSKLAQLAELLNAWLRASSAPPLVAYDLNMATVTALNTAAESLNAALASKPAAKQIDRDSPAINATEGRLLYVMRSLWDDLAEAREDGTTSLLLTVSPALLRGMDVASRRKKEK